MRSSRLCSVSSVEFSHDSSLLAVGSPESCIRLWSMKGEKLKAKSVGESCISCLLPHTLLSVLPFRVCYAKPGQQQSFERLTVRSPIRLCNHRRRPPSPQTNRPLRPSLLSLVRPHIRFRRPTFCSSILISGRYSQIVEHGHILEFGSVQRTRPGACLGCRMGTYGGLLRYCVERSDGEVVE